MSVITINPDKLKPSVKNMSFADFFSKFTSEEKTWIFSSDDFSIRETIALVIAENSVDLASKLVKDFFDRSIELNGPFSEERVAEILSA